MLALIVELVIVVLLVGATILFVRRRSKLVLLIDEIPGPPTLPLVGNALDFNVSKHDTLERVDEFFKRHGPIFRVWLGFQPLVILGAPEYVEAILSSNKEINKGKEYSFLEPWLGTGLLTSKGAKWHFRRKTLTPAFHFKILDDFIDIFNEQSSIMLERFEKVVDKDPVDICPYITLCTLDIICESAMGRHVNAQGNSDSDYVKAIYIISEIIQSRQLKPWLQPNWLFNMLPMSKEHDRCLNLLHGFTKKVYHERKEEFQKEKGESGKATVVDELGRKKRLAFLDLLLETSQNGKVLNDSDICEEIDTFMFEGHDTTAVGIGWTLFCLSCYPEHQQKAYEEIYEIFGDSDRPPTMKDLQDMKYLECCIKEGLRLYPSVPLMARDLMENMKLGKYTVPAGTTVVIAPYTLHRNKEIFPDPEEFKPERFFPENVRGRHPYSYVPFSAGPRNCIGQKFALLEEKALISSVLRRFKLTSAQDRKSISLVGELILRSLNGLKVSITKRV